MNELIPIQYESEKPTVNAWELQVVLKTDYEYAKWFERMCKYGFC